MKKLALAAFSALAFGAFAAPERLGILQLADVNSLVAGVTKFGELIGNPMVSAMVTPSITQNPVSAFFGPGREGVPIMAAAYVESEKLAEGLEQALESVWPVVVYPMTETKEQFLARTPGATETNGVVKVASPETVLVWTADGKWAVASDTADHAKVGLSVISAAARPIGSDLLRIEIGEALLKEIPSLLAKVAEMSADGEVTAKLNNQAEYSKMLEGLSGAKLAMRISDKGWDFESVCTCKPGSLLDTCGKEGSLAPDALAFAGKDAFVAVAQVAKSAFGSYEDFGLFGDVARKHGLKLDFLKTEKIGEAVKLMVDFPAAYAYFTGEEGSQAFEKIDPMTFVQEMDGVTEKFNVALNEKPQSYALGLKGASSAETVAARFAATLPEAATLKPYAVAFLSYYSLVKGLAPQIVAVLPAELQNQVKPLLQTLPAEGKCGVASCSYRKGDAHVQLTRLSADELKGLGAVINAGIGYAMSASMKGADLEDDEDDEDDDLDDDED